MASKINYGIENPSKLILLNKEKNQKKITKGTLFLIATPIGNLSDITLRALETLKSVEILAAEDTRYTEQLLSHYKINTMKITSCFQYNEFYKADLIIQTLQAGKNVGLVTSAGTPGISDPGSLLVAKVISEGLQVIPIPGASALTSIISASGWQDKEFTFFGFLPSRPTQRLKFLENICFHSFNLVFYETARRIKDSLQDQISILGDRDVVLAREMTKIHEEFLRGKLSQIQHQLQQKEIIKGEITLLIKGYQGNLPAADTISNRIPIDKHLELVQSYDKINRKEALKVVAQERGLSRTQVYHEIETTKELKR